MVGAGVLGPLILNSGSRERREVNCTLQPPYPWGKYFWYTSNRLCGPQSSCRLLGKRKIFSLCQGPNPRLSCL